MEKRVSKRFSPLVRGILVLGVVLIAAGAISPSFAAKAVTKAKVKNIIAKQAPGLAVASAKTAGSADNVMAATVPVGDSCVITGQTGGITAVDAAPFCNVTFPVSVDNCVVGATPIHPSADPAGQASVRKLGGAVVRVSRFDGAGGTPTRGLFSLFAVCPPAP